MTRGKSTIPKWVIDANQQAVVDDAQCMSDGLGKGFIGDDTLPAETAVEIKDVEQGPRGSSNKLCKSDGESTDYGGKWFGDVETPQMLATLAAPGEQADQNQNQGGIRDQYKGCGNDDGDC